MRPMKLLATVGLSGLALGASNAIAQHPVQPVRLIAIGDMGTGGAGQYAVAAAIEQVCRQRSCDFALGMGDNIYENGVASEDDQLFVDAFEMPYANLDFPFYMALGNHDNSSSVGLGETNARGDFQVDYYYRQDRSDSYLYDGSRPSAKWVMPARYYTFEAGSEGIRTGSRTVEDEFGNEFEVPVYDYQPLVSFIAVDANPIATPSDPTYDPYEYARDHGRWLERQLKDSQARWQITFHHQPYISNGEHGNAGEYDGTPNTGFRDASGQIFKEFYEDYACGNGLDVAFQGHDHDLQVLKPPADCPQTLFVLSGAGGKTRSQGTGTQNDAFFEHYDAYGFMWVEISDRHMTIIPYTVDETGTYQQHEAIQQQAPGR